MRLHSLPFRPLLLMALFTFTAPGGAPGRASAWPLDGAPVSTGPQSQSGPVIVQSLDTGALIIWTDTRNGNEDIFAQRVDSTGAALWSVDGVAVCAASGVQSNIAAVSTFGGGAAIVWEDQRSSGSIYAQVIDTDGLSLLPFNGMILKSGGLSIMPSQCLIET